MACSSTDPPVDSSYSEKLKKDPTFRLPLYSKNENICYRGTLDTEYSIAVTCFNIANANRDNELHPLIDRLSDLCSQISATNSDVVCLLEGGRPSGTKPGEIYSWTWIASRIEEETGLTYYGVFYQNGTPNPFGKALFYRRSRVFIHTPQQIWLGQARQFMSGPHNGIDIVKIRINPVIRGKVVDTFSFVVAFTHFPMQADHKQEVAQNIQWINNPCDKDERRGLETAVFLKDTIPPRIELPYINPHVIMGDFNTFTSDESEKFIPQIICNGRWIPPKSSEDPLPHFISDYSHFTLSNGEPTFEAFPHDIQKLHVSQKDTIPEGSEVEPHPEDPEFLNVRYKSKLDHIFVSSEFMRYFFHGIRYINHGVGKGSDHAPMTFVLTSNLQTIQTLPGLA